MLRSANRPLAIVALLCGIVLLVACALALGWIPTHIKYCEQNPHTYYKECATYHIALIAVWQTGKILDAIAAPLTALATVAIGYFTWTLWRATTQQGRLTQQSIDLARDEFNATHRPKIIVRSFQIGDHDLPAGKQINFIFFAQNIGDSAAKIIEVHSATFVHNAGDPIPTDLSFPFFEPFNVVLESGQRELFPGNGGSTLVEIEHRQIFAGESDLYCMGTVVYIGAGGTRKRETGFCRRYRPRENRWDIIESEYEYAY
jgi:hypothetical protein